MNKFTDLTLADLPIALESIVSIHAHCVGPGVNVIRAMRQTTSYNVDRLYDVHELQRVFETYDEATAAAARLSKALAVFRRLKS